MSASSIQIKSWQEIRFESLNVDLIKSVFERDEKGRLRNHLFVKSDKLYYTERKKYDFLENLWRFLGCSEGSVRVVAKHLQTIYKRDGGKTTEQDQILNHLLKDLFVQIFDKSQQQNRWWWQRPCTVYDKNPFLSNSLASAIIFKINTHITKTRTSAIAGKLVSKKDFIEAKRVLTLLEKGTEQHLQLTNTLNQYERICRDAHHFLILGKAIEMGSKGRIHEVLFNGVISTLTSISKKTDDHPELASYLAERDEKNFLKNRNQIFQFIKRQFNAQSILNELFQLDANPSDELLRRIVVLVNNFYAWDQIRKNLFHLQDHKKMKDSPEEYYVIFKTCEPFFFLAKLVKAIQNIEQNIGYLTDFKTLFCFLGLKIELSKYKVDINNWTLIKKWKDAVKDKQEEIKKSHIDYIKSLTFIPGELTKSVNVFYGALYFVINNMVWFSNGTINELYEEIEKKLKEFKEYSQAEAKKPDTKFDWKRFSQHLQHLPKTNDRVEKIKNEFAGALSAFIVS